MTHAERLSLNEELALERAAVSELESDADALWRQRQYAAARHLRADAAVARARIDELEAILRKEDAA